jgi:hypothetical protein
MSPANNGESAPLGPNHDRVSRWRRRDLAPQRRGCGWLGRFHARLPGKGNHNVTLSASSAGPAPPDQTPLTRDGQRTSFVGWWPGGGLQGDYGHVFINTMVGGAGGIRWTPCAAAFATEGAWPEPHADIP